MRAFRLQIIVSKVLFENADRRKRDLGVQESKQQEKETLIRRQSDRVRYGGIAPSNISLKVNDVV